MHRVIFDWLGMALLAMFMVSGCVPLGYDQVGPTSDGITYDAGPPDIASMGDTTSKPNRNRSQQEDWDAGMPEDAKELDALSMDVYQCMEVLPLSQQSEAKGVRVVSNGASVYKYPSASSDAVTSLNQLSPVDVIGALPSGWVYVEYAKDSYGWMHSMVLNHAFAGKKRACCRDFEAELTPIFQKRRAEALRKAMESEAYAQTSAREAAAKQARHEALARARQSQQFIDDSDQGLAALNNALNQATANLPDPLDHSGNITSTGGTPLPYGGSIGSHTTSTAGASQMAPTNEYPYPGETYSFTCDDGNQFTIPIPSTRNQNCNGVFKRFAKVHSCNMDADIPQLNEQFMGCQ